MNYKFEGSADIKLLILKTVEYFKTAIPENILIDTILDLGYANFFDLQQAVFELSQDRLLTYYEEKDLRFYSLTRLGETAVEGYQSMLPRSVLEKLYQTVRIKIREYENGLSLIADYEKTGDMDYKVRLGITEGGYEIFTVTLSLFDEKMAQSVCREFKRSPQNLYSEILSVLLNTGESH